MGAKIWILLAIVNIARSRDITVGSNYTGHKIYDENKQASPAIWRQMENVTITANDNEVISKIVITDLRAEKDGDAKILEGGEGQKNVTIELKSPTVLRGYEFHIEAYAVAEDQLKTMGQSSDNTKKNTLKELSSTATPYASETSSVSLDKQHTSTTEASPTNEERIIRRQNRDTENKNKPTQEIQNITPSMTNAASTTEISKESKANGPISTTEKLNQKFPTVNREFHQGHFFDHPRVNIYEVNKMSETIDRSIPSTNVKLPEENINTQGAVNDGESNKNVGTSLNMVKMHTHVPYPQFGVQEKKQSPESVVNTALPFVENEDKNKNVRHRRDVSNPIEENKGIQKPSGIDNKADTDESNPLDNRAQKHDEGHVVKTGTSSSNNPSNLENQYGQDSVVKSQPNPHTAFRDRHLNRKFGKSAIADAHLIPSSTESNKISPTLQNSGDTTQTVSGFIYSQLSPIGKKPLGSTTNPDVTEPSVKSGITTEKLANPELKPKVTSATNTENPHDFSVRHTRDTTSVNNEVISESLLPPVLHSSSTTLKSEIDSKNAPETNVSSTNAQPILGNFKVTEIKTSTDGISKRKAPDSPQSEEKGRNTRDIIDTNNKKEKQNVGDERTDTINASKKIKPVSTLSAHGINESNTKTHQTHKVPTELIKSENTKTSPKDGIKVESKFVDEKERQTRDTSSVDESNDSKKDTEKVENGESKSKLQQRTTLNKEKSSYLENKSLNPSSTLDDKITKQNDEKSQNRDQIPVWNKADQEETRKVNNNGHAIEIDNQQSPKIPRDAKVEETEEPKKSNVGVHPHDISLATDLKISSTERPTYVKPINNNNEKDLKSQMMKFP